MEQVLTSRQRAAIAFIAKEEGLSSFYLSGGTALAAYYFSHRVSDDLDFFTDQAIDDVYLSGFIARLAEELGAMEVRKEKVYDRRLFFFVFPDGELKMEFTVYPFLRLAPLVIHDGIQVDSLIDLSANKLAALMDRFDPKDFVDLFFVLQERPLVEIVRDAEKKFGLKISPLLLGSELMKVKRISALPKMIKPLSVEELQQYFIAQAASLGKGLVE